MLKRYRHLGYLLTLCFVFAACVPTTDGGEDGGDEMTSDFTLQLLHFADVDGGRDVIGNAPRFSALLDSFRAEMPESTLVLSSGDNWIPGPEYNVAGDDALTAALGTAGAGRAHVAWLNALGVQASALGNHEFDLGPGAVAELLAPAPEGNEDGDTWTGAAFPYLSTNLDFSADEDVSALVGADGAPASELAGQIAAYTTVTVGGETVGVIGATTPSLASLTSVGGIAVLPEDAEDLSALTALIQADADALGAAGVDKIVLLAHMQSISIEESLAPLLSGVDIIVAGGSNTLLADSTDRLRDGDSATGNYPLELTGSDGAPILLVNVDGDYNYLGRLVVDFDARGQLLPASVDEAVSGAYAADEQGLSDLGLSSTDAIAEVSTISTLLGGALEARAGNVVGFTEVYLNGERGSVRTEETNLGNLSADANLVYAQSVDPSTAVSLKNGGGIRGPIGACVVPPGTNDPDAARCGPPAGTPGISEAGEISQLDLEIAFRFNNGLTLLDVTGEELVELLEHGLSALEDRGGAFPQLSGVTLSYDSSQPAGSRILALSVNDANGAEAGEQSVSVVVDGSLDANAAAQTFRVVTLGFLAEGGDDYPFPTGAEANVVNLTQEGTQTGSATFTDDGTEQDALAEYLLATYPDSGSPYTLTDTPVAEDERMTDVARQ